jgi:hypothetical protein
MKTVVRWSRALGVSLVIGATSFIPAPMVWAAEECPKGQERDKSGRCVAPCPRGQFRHPSGYCTCGLAIGDAQATLASCAEALRAQ